MKNNFQISHSRRKKQINFNFIQWRWEIFCCLCIGNFRNPFAGTAWHGAFSFTTTNKDVSSMAINKYLLQPYSNYAALIMFNVQSSLSDFYRINLCKFTRDPKVISYAFLIGTPSNESVPELFIWSIILTKYSITLHISWSSQCQKLGITVMPLWQSNAVQSTYSHDWHSHRTHANSLIMNKQIFILWSES